jgi:predicted membrane-bound spermidine synthase
MESAGFNVVPMHVYVPSFRDWGFNIGMNITQDEIQARLKQLEKWNVPTTEVTPAVTKASLAFIKSMKDDTVPVNTITFPVLVRLYRDSWIL